VIYDGRLHVTALGDTRALGEAAPLLLTAAIRTAILDCAASLPTSPPPPATITVDAPA
jgi:ABC-type phosphate transport system permease subunit